MRWRAEKGPKDRLRIEERVTKKKYIKVAEEAQDPLIVRKDIYSEDLLIY